MTSETFQKYQKYKVAELKVKAQMVFNRFIRERDKDLPCVSCGSWNTSQASHFYSAGKHQNLRFDEDNVHLSCLKCNYYEHGNLLPYREQLIKRIGQQRVDRLDFLARTRQTKLDRFYLIEIIEKYK